MSNPVLSLKDVTIYQENKVILSQINLEVNQIGIFGKLTQLDHVMRERDRIEIYRPLIADPKEIRRQRAAEGKVMKKGGDSA